MKTKEELPACPVATTVSLIGSKWKLLIMRNLLARPWRFNELRKDLDGISQKVLTDSLRSMEADGLVVRTVYAEVPPRVEYALSPLGESMKPIIKSMETWGLGLQERHAARNGRGTGIKPERIKRRTPAHLWRLHGERVFVCLQGISGSAAALFAGVPAILGRRKWRIQTQSS